jgi:hypothetical protein
MIVRDANIVLEIKDGVAVSLVHAAAQSWDKYVYGGWRTLDSLESPPLRWVSACGVQGWVYAYGGYALGMPICEECRAIVDPALAKAA